MAAGAGEVGLVTGPLGAAAIWTKSCETNRAKLSFLLLSETSKLNDVKETADYILLHMSDVMLRYSLFVEKSKNWQEGV